jgi:hypothetical protein
MASQINPNTINSNYPVAGQDNDSQGFRDNFSRIKVALTTASSEITNLQLYSAKLNDTNNFDGNTIQNAILQNTGTPVQETAIENNSQAHPATLYFNSAPYHKVYVTTSTEFTIDTWPGAGVYGNLRLEVTPINTDYPDTNTRTGYATTASGFATTVTFTTVDNLGYIWKEGAMPLPINIGTMTNKTTVFDLWTTDAGASVFVKFIGTYTQV